jgi:hypothetical protein
VAVGHAGRCPRRGLRDRPSTSEWLRLVSDPHLPGASVLCDGQVVGEPPPSDLSRTGRSQPMLIAAATVLGSVAVAWAVLWITAAGGVRQSHETFPEGFAATVLAIVAVTGTLRSWSARPSVSWSRWCGRVASLTGCRRHRPSVGRHWQAPVPPPVDCWSSYPSCLVRPTLGRIRDRQSAISVKRKVNDALPAGTTQV